VACSRYLDSCSSTPYRFAADCIRFHAARRSASVTSFTWWKRATALRTCEAFSSGSLRCLGKANLLADIRSRTGLVNFAIVSLPRGISCARRAPGLFTTDYDSFSSSCSVVWLTSYSSRVDSAMSGSSSSFLTRARSAWLESCLGWLLCILARCHASKGITGQLGTELTTVELFFLPSSFAQFVPLCET